MTISRHTSQVDTIFAEDLQLIALSQQRIDNGCKHTISFEGVLERSGITQEDLDATPMPELE